MSTDKPEKPPASVYTLTEPDIDSSDIWKDDCLNRQKISDKLTKIVRNAGMQNGGRHGYVISINGGWGTGKSFMLSRWQKELEKDGCVAIYFDAWQDDFIANPLVAIIGQLQKMLEQSKVQEVGIAQEAKGKFLKLAKNMRLNLSLGVASVSIPIGELSEQGEDDIVQQYHKEKDNLEELRESLGGLVVEIREHTEFPLVFIIDELDRCRPTFAVEVLERVKHLFNLPGVVFVFGINRSQLEKSIQSVYGDIDAGEYLRKFFNLDLNLPAAKPSKYCRNLLIERIHDKDMLWFLDNLYLLAMNSMGLTLREVEYFARLFELAFLIEKPKHDISDYSIVCLALLKTKYQEMYYKFINGKCQCKDVINKMTSTWGVESFYGKLAVREFFQMGIYPLAKDDEWGKIYDDLKNYNLSSEIFADITKEESKNSFSALKQQLEIRGASNYGRRKWKERVFGLFDFVEYVVKDEPLEPN